MRVAAELCAHGGTAPALAQLGWSAEPLAPALAVAACDASRPASQALAIDALSALARSSPATVSRLLVQHILPVLDAHTAQSPSSCASGCMAALVLHLLGSAGAASEQLSRYLELTCARSEHGGHGGHTGSGDEPGWFSRLLPLMI